MHHYAKPEDTPRLMKELMDWYRSAKDYPVLVAAELHYRFVAIHPFDDGNGRIARLLVNYHLLRNGFPPVVIKMSRKNHYLHALMQADKGDMNVLIEHIMDEVLWSLKLSQKAAKGEVLEEDDDWDKKVTVVAREVRGHKLSRDIEEADLLSMKLRALYNNIDVFRATFLKYFRPLEQFYEGARIGFYVRQLSNNKEIVSRIIGDLPKEEIVSSFRDGPFRDAIHGTANLKGFKYGSERTRKVYIEMNIQGDDQFKIATMKKGSGPWYFEWDHILTEEDLQMMREEAEELLEELRKNAK
jgi:hypothetical protein